MFPHMADTPEARELIAKNVRVLTNFSTLGWTTQQALKLDIKAGALLPIVQPRVTLGKRCNKTSTKNPSYAQISLHHIREWQGLTRQITGSAYGDLLNSEVGIRVDERRRIIERTIETYQIHCEGDLTDMGKNWMKHLLDPCLTQCANALLKRLGKKPKNLELLNSQKLKLLSNSNGKRKHEWLYPDWMVLDLHHPNNVQKLENNNVSRIAEVVGDDKLSTVFNPESLDDLILKRSSMNKGSDGDEQSNLTLQDHTIWCLRQIATYAFIAETRYAFIRTDKTITLFRFFAVEYGSECPVHNTFGFEYQWAYIDKPAGPDTFSLNLGIFTLTMMAQNDCHRAIVKEEVVNDIGVWYEKISNGKTSYFHPLSRITLDKKPSYFTKIVLRDEEQDS
ncbi:hypothetical protein F5Y18DRAFT_424787 [Xylariaceae sp. FL1019]|nr:hypothetical protein F5Y18DRAFT_424787 [Xylariaceae sp. FL1019]